jgi:hypothetical protein
LPAIAGGSFCFNQWICSQQDMGSTVRSCPELSRGGSQAFLYRRAWMVIARRCISTHHLEMGRFFVCVAFLLQAAAPPLRHFPQKRHFLASVHVAQLT